MPINDNQDTTSTGGSHWSVLIFDRTEHTLLYYDSMQYGNLQEAKSTAKKISPLIDPKLSVNIVSKATPQQINSFDCGLYVLAISELIAKNGSTSVSLVKNITPEIVAHKRKEVRDLIAMYRLKREEEEAKKRGSLDTNSK